MPVPMLSCSLQPPENPGAWVLLRPWRAGCPVFGRQTAAASGHRYRMASTVVSMTPIEASSLASATARLLASRRTSRGNCGCRPLRSGARWGWAAATTAARAFYRQVSSESCKVVG